jgi:hypothetical protein
MKSCTAVVAAAGLLLVAVPACKSDPGGKPAARSAPTDGGPPAPRRPETAVITGVEIRWIGSPEPHPVRDDDLSARLRGLLTTSMAFVAEESMIPAGRSPAPADIELALRHELVRVPPRGGAKGGQVIVVGVEAGVEWKGGGERLSPTENVLIERPLEPGDDRRVDRLVAELVERAVEQAGRGLVAKETLRQADDAELLSALGSDDPDRVAWVLELCAARRLAGAFDRAVALLDSRDPGVQAAALQLLVALRDPRAVSALAKRADFADPEMMRVLVEAVTAIGGPEAIEFLEMVAGGHAEADMRRRAEEGLERLGRRRERRNP